MQQINLLENRETLKYKIFKFPDGEIHFELLDELNHKDWVKVITRITCADDLFILMQINDILTRHEIYWELHITYLMSARMDRVMSWNRPLSLKIVRDIIDKFSAGHTQVLEPHNQHCFNLARFKYDKYINNMTTLVYPDKGAASRYNWVKKCFNNGYVIFEKEREESTGKILSFKADTSKVQNTEHFTFIDDLCDGGGTFLGELEILSSKYSSATYEIIVCHAVNEDGLYKLCENFDRVVISDSYTDWSLIKAFYPNLEVVKV